MKIQLYWLLLAALLLLSGKADAANNKKPFVIPELQEWRGAQGMFTPTVQIIIKFINPVRVYM